MGRHNYRLFASPLPHRSQRFDLFQGDLILRGFDAVFLDGNGNRRGGIGLGIGQNAAGLGLLFGGIEFCVGIQFDRALFTLGLGHIGAAGAFGVQLLQHRGAGRLVQVDIQNLSPRHLDSPVIHQQADLFTHIRRHFGPVGLQMIQFHLADLGPDDPGDRGSNGGIHIADPVNGLFGFGNAVKHRCFHLDQHVVGSDRILMGGGQLAFQHRYLMRNPVQKRHDKVDARPQNRAQPPEPFHHEFVRLRHDPHAQKNADDDEQRQQDQEYVLPQKLRQKLLNIQNRNSFDATTQDMNDL